MMRTPCAWLFALLAGAIGLSGVSRGAPTRLSEAGAASQVKLSRDEGGVPLFARLPDRLRYILKEQTALAASTRALHQAIQAAPDQKPRPEDRQGAQKLATRQHQLVGDVNKIIALLNEDGTAVAFTEVFQQLRDDMKRIQGHLEQGNLNTAAKTMEDDIIATFQEMLEALRKSR